MRVNVSLLDEAQVARATHDRNALLALLTGQRRTEITATRKSDDDLEGAKPTLTVPRGLPKNRNTHPVPLSPQAVGNLQKAIDESGDRPFVFPGNKEGSPIASRSVSKTVERTRKAIGPGNLSMHDLMRTAGTLMSQYGVPQNVRERIFNHGSMRNGSLTEGVYNRHEYDAEKRSRGASCPTSLSRSRGAASQKSTATVCA